MRRSDGICAGPQGSRNGIQLPPRAPLRRPPSGGLRALSCTLDFVRKVEKLESGRYKVRFRLERGGGQKPKQSSESFATKREADQFARWLDAVGVQAALDLLYEGDQ